MSSLAQSNRSGKTLCHGMSRDRRCQPIEFIAKSVAAADKIKKVNLV
ncbi:MAG: hypothetical protein F6K04_07910 [Leptolyngbya sp. SIO4C5]|nr:hypothetical protein [Leptolyngbya sp. SIO4C5]